MILDPKVGAGLGDGAKVDISFILFYFIFVFSNVVHSHSADWAF